MDKVKIIYDTWPYTFPIRIPGYYYISIKRPKEAWVVIKDTMTGKNLMLITTRAEVKKSGYKPYWPQYEN